MRLKAEKNNWATDSIWVQFSGSADPSGTPAYRTGTGSGLAVSLEECVSCGVSGWGWADDGWGAVNTNGVRLRFPEGGLQSIQIQTREDGVSVDQVVLSAEKYLTTRPGAAKSDATILKRTFRSETRRQTTECDVRASGRVCDRLAFVTIWKKGNRIRR